MATVQIKSWDSSNQAEVTADNALKVTDGGSSIAVDADLVEVGGQPITLGQKTMADSLPVVIASDQSPVDVEANIVEVSGSAITLGQKTEANSFPVVIASDQSPIDVVVTNSPAVVDTNLIQVSGSPITLGQKTSAASLPVVLSSDQPAVPVTVSGSVTSNQGTSPWVTNVTQFGSSNVVTGTGTSGAGIPRVTVASDSTVSANINGLAAFKVTGYTIGTSAVQLAATPLTNRSSVSIKAITTTSLDKVFIGINSSVTTTLGTGGNGYFLFNGDTVQIDLTAASAIWAIGTSAGQFIAVMESGN